MPLKFLVLSLLFASFAGVARASSFDHTYKQWDQFLKTHVKVISGGNASQFDYDSAKKDPHLLDQFIQNVESVKESDYNSWTDAQKQAFLINSYNALTVKWILKNGIPSSIKDTGSWFSSPWKKKFFTLFGKKSYLDHIEQDLARAHFNNCRLHFAFNCASIGCPMIRPEAWLPQKLQEQFEDSAKHFLSDESRNMYDAKSNSLEISKIFDWYGKDFEKDKSCGGSVKAFVSRYMKHEGRPVPASANVKFMEYDWTLNSVK